jgi:hypothetical protein
MSDRKEHDALTAAAATRARTIETVRREVEEVVERLQRDVFRLIDDAQRDLPEPPSPTAGRGHEKERERRHLDAELREAIVDIVRAEIAALDVAALVKAEIDTQLRTVTRLLQERLKVMAKPSLQKLKPILSRRRR